MQPSKRIGMTMLTSLAIVVAAQVVAAQLEITRSTMDGGGAMRSTGGNFELSGTIGQPDAGLLTSAGLTLTGGFWFGTPHGDGNEDGVTDILDLPFFEECLLGPAGLPPTGICRGLDRDGSGKVDLMDFAAMQRAFRNG